MSRNLGWNLSARPKKEERPFGLFLLLNAFVPMLALAVGQSMVYDNDRLFIGAMPFIAALAAIGFFAAVNLLQRWLAGRRLQVSTGLLVAAVLLPQLWAVSSLYPHLLSYYSEGIGGVGGAVKLGLEATYWCETYNEVLAYLNEHAEPDDIVYVTPYSHDVMIYYQRQGLLRDDIHFAAPFNIPSVFDESIFTTLTPFNWADFVVFQNRGTSYGEMGLDSPIARWMAIQEPDYELAHDGVPLIRVYKQ